MICIYSEKNLQNSFTQHFFNNKINKIMFSVFSGTTVSFTLVRGINNHNFFFSITKWILEGKGGFMRRRNIIYRRHCNS